MGYCRRGRDVQYIILKDLFKHKKPSVLIIEVAEDEPKKSHPVFPYVAESKDLLRSCVFFNQRYISNIWKGIAVRFEQLKYNVFKNNYPAFLHNAGFGYLSSNQVALVGDFVQNRTVWQERKAKQKSELYRKIELNYSKHYLEKIVKICRENNCKIIFLYLPESGSEIKKPLLSEFYARFGKIITIPDSIISNHRNWKDAIHFNDNGAKKATDFVIHKLESDY